jgi:hypothetical protein
MSWIKGERDEFINEYERKYGVRISEKDEMLPIMHYIYTAGLESVAKLRQIEKLVAKVDKSLNEPAFSRTQIVLQDGEAWSWQVGIAVKILLLTIGILGSITVCSIIVNWSSAKKEEAAAIIEAAPIIQKDLLKRVEVDIKGNHFLRFVPDRGNGVELFKEYQLQKDSSIHIYLKSGR